MSKTFKSINSINPASLHEELKAAGFEVETVYGDGRVQLADTEFKDLSAVLAAHDPSKPTQAELANQASQLKVQAARDRLKIIKAKGKISWTVEDRNNIAEAAMDILGI